MALGVSRLLLSLSAMKRSALKDADFILTQSGLTLLSQMGRHILAEQSKFDTLNPAQLVDFVLTQNNDFIAFHEFQAPDRLFLAEQSAYSTEPDPDPIPPPLTFLLTQSGQLFITQDDRPLGAEQTIYDYKSEFDQIMMTQDFRLVTTQAGDFLIYPTPTIHDIILTQDGLGLTDQNNDLISIQNNRAIASLAQNNNTGIILVTQDGFVLTTNQELDAA